MGYGLVSIVGLFLAYQASRCNLRGLADNNCCLEDVLKAFVKTKGPQCLQVHSEAGSISILEILTVCAVICWARRQQTTCQRRQDFERRWDAHDVHDDNIMWRGQFWKEVQYSISSLTQVCVQVADLHIALKASTPISYLQKDPLVRTILSALPLTKLACFIKEADLCLTCLLLKPVFSCISDTI